MVVPLIAGIAGLSLRALPYMARGAKALVNKQNLKNYFVGKPKYRSGKGGLEAIKNKFGIQSRSTPGIAKVGPYGSNLAFTSGVTGAGYMGYDYLTDDAKQSADTPPVVSTSPQDKNIQPAKPDEKPKDDAKMTSDQIKSGELDDFIKERIDLFEKYIGDDTRKRTKTAGYNAMVQFGLNLATKRGSLVEGIAESAKEPLKEFAKLGNDLMDRAASIKKAGIEAGVSAYDKAEDRKIDREALATEIIKEKLKQDAKTLTRGEFITSALQDITGNETLMNALSDPYYKDGKRDPNAPSDSTLAEAYAARQYDIYRAVEIPPGAAGQELYDSLPSGTRIYDPSAINEDGTKGGYANKP
tara:strand:+ start:736 stop:1803 length:1068 start_codon:yes stop_codon:yes gene_type:complete